MELYEQYELDYQEDEVEEDDNEEQDDKDDLVELNELEEQEELEEQDEEESGADTFEELTLEEGMLISSSSENIIRFGQTHGDRKDAYRKIVEKLIKNTGILCKNDMDNLQRKYLKKAVTDFRRQVVPRHLNYNAGGTLERHEV